MTDAAALKREQARLRKARWRVSNRERERQRDKIAKRRQRARQRVQATPLAPATPRVFPLALLRAALAL